MSSSTQLALTLLALALLLLILAETWAAQLPLPLQRFAPLCGQKDVPCVEPSAPWLLTGAQAVGQPASALAGVAAQTTHRNARRQRQLLQAGDQVATQGTAAMATWLQASKQYSLRYDKGSCFADYPGFIAKDITGMCAIRAACCVTSVAALKSDLTLLLCSSVLCHPAGCCAATCGVHQPCVPLALWSECLFVWLRLSVVI